MKIYHNPRCRNSREGLLLLESSHQDFEIIDYLNNPPTEKELTDILKMLGLNPIQLVRKNETVWKENYKNKELTNAEIVRAMCENPKLIERPIVISGNKAVLGRPPENIEVLLK